MKSKLYMLPLLLLAALLPAAARGDDADQALRLGSLARQQFLKQRLRQVEQGTLASSLGHNRRQWESLSPQQREKVRSSAYAYLRQSEQRQQELIRHYDEVIKGTAERRETYERRASWLGVVVESFTAEQRQAMSQMTPAGRARMLLDRRDQLVSEGKLVLEPASQPATAPASAPAAD
jgi:hypothetical protein